MTTSAWKTGKRHEGCGACAAPFEPGDVVVSTLAESEPEDDEPGFVRHDLCETCFEARPAASFCWWRSEVPPPESRRAAFDLNVAREFLLRLLREDTPERASLRYLLALLLMRKRIVRVEEQFSDENGERMTFRVPPDETVYEIDCPEIDEDEATTLRDQLGRLFDLGDGDGDGER